MQTHRGAAFFPAEARRAVAEGPLFVRQSAKGAAMVREDGCCVVGALLRAVGVGFDADGNLTDEATLLAIPCATTALQRATGRDPDTITPYTEEVGDIMALMDLNDEGAFAGEGGRENLRRALLGRV